MKKISSIQNPIVQFLKSLHLSKNRYEHQQFLVEGKYLVQEAMAQKRVRAIFVVEEYWKDYTFLTNFQGDIFLVTLAVIKKIAQTINPQPIVGLCDFPKMMVKNPDNIILLDNIQDPGNLGAILRSCCAFGVTKIFLSYCSVDIFNHKVVSASKGAIFKVAFEYCALETLMANLKEEHYHLYGTFLHQDQQPTTLHNLKFHQKNAFLFGNESKGVSLQLQDLIDENFIITTTNQVESLNLAISVSLTIYSLFLNRKQL